jgi:hypothetical protein
VSNHHLVQLLVDQKLCDTHDQSRQDFLDGLKEYMLFELEGASAPSKAKAVTTYAELPVASYDASDRNWNEYITQWEHDIRLRLRSSLHSIIGMRKAWLMDGCEVGLRGTVLAELLHHAKWGSEKCRQFNGRTELLKDMMKLFVAPNRTNDQNDTQSRSRRRLWASKKQSSISVHSLHDSSTDAEIDTKGSFDGISFAMIGSSGSGKTSLMAKLAAVVHEMEVSSENIDDFGEVVPARPVILRFCGSSSGSVSGLSLVCGIISQIQYVLDLDRLDSDGLRYSPGRSRHRDHSYHDSDIRGLETLLQLDYDSAVSQLHKLLHEHPVVLFIDSIDQLSDDYLARSRISFLDGVKPHPQTRIIISALPDERDPVSGAWLYCYQCHTRCKESNVPVVEVRAFTTVTQSLHTAHSADNTSEFKAVLQRVLASRERKLTLFQWKVVLSAAEAEPTALYANLVARVVQHWKSYDNDCQVEPTVRGLLNQTFDDLERRFGSVLTKAAIGFITFSVAGLTDNEIEDLLSMDDNVLTSVFQYAKSKVPRLPSHVWLRLRGAMTGLLVERTAGCLNWYHRQLQETALLRYSEPERKRLHALMGIYFSNNIPLEMRQRRHIASQPLTLTTTNIFFASTAEASGVNVNMRRITESLQHLVQSEMYAEFVGQIRNVEMIYAMILWGNAFSLVLNLSVVASILQKAGGCRNAEEGAILIDCTEQKTSFENCCELLGIVDHYLRWFRLDMTTIIEAPERALFATVTGK